MIKPVPNVLKLMDVQNIDVLKKFEKYKNYTLNQLMNLNMECAELYDENPDANEIGSLIAWVLGRIKNKRIVSNLKNAILLLNIITPGSEHHCECIRSLSFHGNFKVLKFLYEIYEQSDDFNTKYAIIYAIGNIGYDANYTSKSNHYLKLIDELIKSDNALLKNSINENKKFQNLINDYAK